ncbi:MAG: hypothetical protein HUJ74_00045 [Lachnospiraceae bacterium]|nr:hypothetical protein [Lachnospiraceae bacterium]
MLEALGIKIDFSPEKSAEFLKKITIYFMFSQNHHLSMKIRLRSGENF